MIRILNRYLYFSTLFKYHIAPVCIQERHYQTSAIKNHLFKHYGGKISSTLQKNIIQCGHNSFYYDIDILFSIGQKTADRAIEYGGRIGKVAPVGSLFMNYYWFYSHNVDKQNNQIVDSNKFDILCLGFNKGDFQNTYDSYFDDYYEHFCWLVKFSQKYPQFKIGVKHHSNNKPDPNELKIFAESSVVRIDQKACSYSLAFQSKCIVSFGSTMGYELIGHGKSVLFLDPGRRNTGFLPNSDLVDDFRTYSFEEFEQKVLIILQDIEKFNINETTKSYLCLPSDKSDEKIFEILNNDCQTS